MDEKKWQQWKRRVGERLRGIALRVLHSAVGEPPGQPAPTGTVKPAQSAKRAAQLAAADMTSPTPTRTARIAASPGTAADDAAPAPERVLFPGKWHEETATVLTGRVDLAPWVPPVRNYRIYEPAVLAADPCILLVLHGCRQSAADIAEGTRLNEHADQRGWLVIYPEQMKIANKNNCWNWFDPANHRGDGECALVIAMHDAVRKRYNLAAAPTYLAGMSAGGALASQLALLYPARWAAVAIHSGMPYGAATDPWAALRVMREGVTSLAAARALRAATPKAPAIPALILHGNKDPVVNRRNADMLVRQFLGWDGYFGKSEAWEDAPIRKVEDSHVKTRYGHPYILRDFLRPSRVQVRECEVVGMGHAWSGGDSALPYHDELGPDASALMVEFFAGVRNETIDSALTPTVH